MYNLQPDASFIIQKPVTTQVFTFKNLQSIHPEQTNRNGKPTTQHGLALPYSWWFI